MPAILTQLVYLRYQASNTVVVIPLTFKPRYRVRVDTKTVHRARVDTKTVHRVRVDA